jgi:hypothetical protein
MANIPLPGYPTAVGNKMYWRGDHVGPLLYVTGGEFIPPQAFGMQGIEEIGAAFSGNSFSTTYYVRMVPPANAFSANEQYASAWGANASNANNTNQIAVQWFYQANNAQVAANTNLAAEAVRFTVWGV